jgi:hypothetical protein
VADEQDAAQLRVLEARAELAEELAQLEASTRAALDFPAKIRRSPAKAAAIAAGVAFLAVKGPQRLFGAARRAVRGAPEPLPSRMLPEEIERTLRKMGNDGDKVRGTLERDFAEYAKKSQQARSSLRTVMLLAVARPLLGRAAKALGDRVFSPDQETFMTRLAEIRDRAAEGAGGTTDDGAAGTTEGADADASAQGRIASARRGEPGSAEAGGAVPASPGASSAPNDEAAPTGI